MQSALLAADESARLAALAEYNILDTLPEQAYDDITFLAAQITRSPIALVSLVDASRQWFKSHHGLDASELSRDQGFCAHAILQPDDLFVVTDALKDGRCADNPLVTGNPGVRFYAGAPLVSPGGHALGTLCVLDYESRTLSTDQLDALRALARQVIAHLELRRSVAALRKQFAQQKDYQRMVESYQKRLEVNTEKMQTQSCTDAMTGLLNRRAFSERLDDEFHRATRYDHALSLLVLDVDYFKKYNEACGHTAGDDALRRVADVIRSIIRSSDVAARLGGEEFAVVLPDTRLDGAMTLAERLRRAIESEPWEERPITASIGVAALSRHVAVWEELLTAADRALYQAKQGGRNCTRDDVATRERDPVPLKAAVSAPGRPPLT